jgi:hypothetical protein
MSLLDRVSQCDDERNPTAAALAQCRARVRALVSASACLLPIWLAGCSSHDTDGVHANGAAGIDGGFSPLGAGPDGNAMTPGFTPSFDAGVIAHADASAGRPRTNDASMPGLVLEVIDECGSSNEAGLSASDIQRLKSGGPAGGLRYIYPYDGTVFPRGMKAPLLMWQGDAATAVYLRIRSQYFQYDGCLRPTANGQLQLKQELWEKIGLHTLGRGTPYTIELTTLEGGAVRGPIREDLVVAQATLKGSLYYNSYSSQLASAVGFSFGGAILRIRPGQDAEFFLRPNTCTGCHTVSANGGRLIAAEIGFESGQVYELTPTTTANPAPKRGAASAGFVGLSPDGAVYATTASRAGVGASQGAGGGLFDVDSVLIETDTGTVLTNSGLPTSALMPTFSPDGKFIVFNDFAQGAGFGLSLMDYDAAARKAQNERSVYKSPSSYLGWPFVLPDNRGVIFTEGESPDFSGGGVGLGALFGGPRSDLKLVDLKSGTATLLARAMGFATPEDAASNKTYLPFGAEELHQTYYPTVSPVASGGYFWVFFDSMRHYGNLGLQRQLWGTAIAIAADGNYTADPSHPAFYVSGQELGTANHRAFAALDPCRQDGTSCETGIDCCSGFCTDGVCGPPQQCANIDEACKTSSDCCNQGDECIGGFCGVVILR